MTFSLNESLTQWNHRDDPCTTGTETETLIQYSLTLSCELTGQSAPLLMEKIFHMSSEAQRVSYDIKSIILKTQPIIRDMKWSTHTKTHSNEKFLSSHSFLPQHHVSDFRANVVSLNGITELRIHAFHF